MILLIIGILLWIAAHLFKRVAPDLRDSIGAKGKGLVALVLVGSIVLMVLGYRSMDFIPVWEPAPFLKHINNLAVLIAFYLTSPGPYKGAIFYKMRHPMLIGFKLWAAAHLLVNGDLASIILFGGMLAWGVIEVIVINRSEPDWTPNAKGTLTKDAMYFGISIVLVGVVGYIHGLIGPSPFAG